MSNPCFAGGILSGLGIATYFDFVLASYELKYAKPDPRLVISMSSNQCSVTTCPES